MSPTRSYTLCLHVFVLHILFLCSCHEVIRGPASLDMESNGGIIDDLSDDLSDDQIQEIVTKLNAIRSGVGASNMMKLEWSKKLGTLVAAKLVNSCPQPSKLSSTMTPCAHVYGNYYVTNDVTLRLPDVIGRWKEQGLHYDYTDNSCSEEGKCVHYRHLVWHTADRVGCGVKSCHTPTSDGATVTRTRLFLCYFSPGSPTLDRPYLQGRPGSDCPPHLTVHGLCTGGAHISCPPEAASFSMSNTDGTAGGDVVTVDDTQVADKSLLQAINYIATGDAETASTTSHMPTESAPLPAPLNAGNQNAAVTSSKMALPEWAAWFVVVAVGTGLLMVLAALFIEYKKRTLLLEETLHPDFQKPRKYPNQQNRYNNQRRHRRRRANPANRILPRLERRHDLHLHRPARAFNNNHFRSHSRAPPTGQLPHYTGARSDLYEEVQSSRPQRPRGRNRRESGSQRRLLNSPSGSPEPRGRPHSGGRRFPSSTTSIGLWPPTGIPITNIGNGNYGNNGNNHYGNGQNGNHANRQNADNGNHGPTGNHDNNGHHGQYENHWGEADHYQNLGAPPPYHARPDPQRRHGSSHTINDFLIQDFSDVL